MYSFPLIFLLRLSPKNTIDTGRAPDITARC